MEMHNTAMGQDAAHDPSATSQQQDAQYTELSNLGQIISGSMPEKAGVLGAPQATEGDVAAQHQGEIESFSVC
jgi:hypothetical protein